MSALFSSPPTLDIGPMVGTTGPEMGLEGLHQRIDSIAHIDMTNTLPEILDIGARINQPNSAYGPTRLQFEEACIGDKADMSRISKRIRKIPPKEDNPTRNARKKAKIK